ncbi:MAG: 50S ribosomal protein L6, partial [Neisseriaceae bacterium]|nr:50S ribosomal protein L6 [Neisseriaceae bacterium]
MSRIAKNPVSIPEGIDVKVNNNEIIVKGKQGEMKQKFKSNLVNVVVENNEVKFEAKSSSKASNAMSGTLRAIVANMVHGVSEGFQKKLQLIGVGYR